MAKLRQGWYESDDDSLPSLPPSSPPLITATNTISNEPITISGNAVVPSCITFGAVSPTPPKEPHILDEDKDKEISHSAISHFKSHQNDDDDYVEGEYDLRYEDSSATSEKPKKLNSETVHGCATEIMRPSGGNVHPNNSSTNNYGYATHKNPHIRTCKKSRRKSRRKSRIQPPSARMTLELVGEEKLKHELPTCASTSIYRGVCCLNTRKYPSMKDSTSQGVQECFATPSNLVHTCDCCTEVISNSSGGSSHARDNAQVTSTYTPSLHMPTPPSASRNVSRCGSRLRVTVRVKNSTTNGGNGRDGLNSVENNHNIIREGSGKGEIIVTNPSKVSNVAAVLLEANLASFDWAKVFHFDETIVVDADYAGNEMDDVFESTVRPVLHGVFHEGISGAIFALQPSQTLPCTQGTTESNHTGQMFYGDGTSVAQRASLEIGQHLDSQYYSASLCFLHIDDNGIRDLLNGHHNVEEQRHLIRVRDHPETGPFAENATYVKAEGSNELQHKLKIGSVTLKNLSQRLNGSTTGCAMLILDITRLAYGDPNANDELQGTEIDDINNLKPSALGNVRLCLIDLATRLPISNNSPSLSAITTSPPVSPRRETARAATALGKVLRNLAIGESNSVKTKKIVPWRDSNITWLLRGTLGRHKSQASLLVTVPSSASNYHQSMATLLYVEHIMMAPNNTNNLEQSGGSCEVSLKMPLCSSSPESCRKLRQLVCDLKVDREEVANALFVNTVADPRQRIAKLMGLSTGTRRQLQHNRSHTKEKVLLSSSMEQQHNHIVPPLDLKTTVCAYTDEKPEEQLVCNHNLLPRVEVEAQNNCIPSSFIDEIGGEQDEKRQEISNLPHNGIKSEFVRLDSTSSTKHLPPNSSSIDDQLCGAEHNRRKSEEQTTMHHQTPESRTNEVNLLLPCNVFHGKHVKVMGKMIRQAENINDERLKKTFDSAEFFEREQKKEERLSTAVNSDKHSKFAGEKTINHQGDCHNHGSALVQAELSDDFFAEEEENHYAHCDASPLAPPLSASSRSCSLLNEENTCCNTNKKRAATSKSKLPLTFVDMKDLTVVNSRQQIHVEDECSADAQKTPVPKEDTLTQTTIEIERVRVGEEIINPEMIVLRGDQSENVPPPPGKQQIQNQMQEVDGTAIYKVENGHCETGGGSIGLMKSVVILPERTATTTDDCVPKRTISTEVMTEQQGALGDYESEIIAEDREGGQMQVLVQMLVAARLLTAESKRELKIERAAHEVTKGELNRILLSTAASNKLESAISEEKGLRGNSDDIAVVVGQEETLKSLTMEVQHLASELKIERSERAHEIEDLQIQATRQLEEALSAVLDSVKKQAGVIQNLVDRLIAEKEAAEIEALWYARFMNETKDELADVDDALIYALEVEGVPLDTLISKTMNAAQFSALTPRQKPSRHTEGQKPTTRRGGVLIEPGSFEGDNENNSWTEE